MQVASKEDSLFRELLGRFKVLILVVLFFLGCVILFYIEGINPQERDMTLYRLLRLLGDAFVVSIPVALIHETAFKKYEQSQTREAIKNVLITELDHTRGDDPCGHWIYLISDKTTGKPFVYGHFRVFRLAHSQHTTAETHQATGEAFNIGKEPDRSHDRRGIWQTSSISCLKNDQGHMQHLDFHYDILLQNPRPGEGRHYKGNFKLKKSKESKDAPFFQSKLHGEIFAKINEDGSTPSTMTGRFTAKKLSSPLTASEDFTGDLHNAFRSLGFSPYELNADSINRERRGLS